MAACSCNDSFAKLFVGFEDLRVKSRCNNHDVVSAKMTSVLKASVPNEMITLVKWVGGDIFATSFQTRRTTLEYFLEHNKASVFGPLAHVLSKITLILTCCNLFYHRCMQWKDFEGSLDLEFILTSMVTVLKCKKTSTIDDEKKSTLFSSNYLVCTVEANNYCITFFPGRSHSEKSKSLSLSPLKH